VAEALEEGGLDRLPLLLEEVPLRPPGQKAHYIEFMDNWAKEIPRMKNIDYFNGREFRLWTWFLTSSSLLAK
jgi:hypothetical protein